MTSMKRGLQTILAIPSVLPRVVGALGFVLGVGLLVPAGEVNPLDSQFRFIPWQTRIASPGDR
jgi:ABC-type Fe3+ transport system permease subunit